MLSREQILVAKETLAGTIAVPEWGGDVGVRRLSAAEVVAMRDAADEGNQIDWVAGFLGSVLCDDAGAALFPGDDWRQLKTRSIETLLRLSKEAQRLNGIGAEATEAARKN
jgi:hypothetical protein